MMLFYSVNLEALEPLILFVWKPPNRNIKTLQLCLKWFLKFKQLKNGASRTFSPRVQLFINNQITCSYLTNTTNNKAKAPEEI